MILPNGNTLALALKCQQAGDLGQAEKICQQILQGHPAHADALHLLGVVTSQLGQPELGLKYVSQALAVHPENVGYLSNLAWIHQTLDRLDEAVALYQQALQLRPGDADVLYKLGTARGAQGRLDEAVACYQQALEHRPHDADVCNNLGNALMRQGRLEAAITFFQRGLALKPDDATLHTNLGHALKEGGHFSEALRTFQRAIQLNPELAEAHLNLGTTLLQLGDFAQGWPKYEWRRLCQGCVMPSPQGWPWNGAVSPGMKILLRAEQGLGDTLQFIRYAPLVKQRGARVIVECQKPLLRLASTCAGIDALVGAGTALPEFDAEAPLMSLPGLLRTTLDTVPAQVPYLFAETGLVQKWREQLAAFTGFKIGIAWQGNPSYAADRFRSIPLRHYAPLAALPQVQLFSLQKGHGTDQVAHLDGRFALIDCNRLLDYGPGDFMDTAALVTNLDLVVTSDTALAHLAGALAVPVWVALPFVPSWRWLNERPDCPWYPTMRLFRQPQPGDWQSVFERMGAALRQP